MIKWLKKLFREKNITPLPKEGRYYDLQHKYWGHNIEFKEQQADGSWRVYGWLTPTIGVGDLLLHKATKGIGVWLMTKVENCNDPHDMFFGNAGLVRYATEEDYAKLKNQNTNNPLQFV